MKETIIRFTRAANPAKKYTAYVRHHVTHKVRKVSFGASEYEQYKDSTPLHLYSSRNHLDAKRRRNYYSRHSKTSSKKQAIKREIQKSSGLYTPKLLSHLYLW